MNLKKLEAKTWRILLLSAAFFLSGLLFFFFRMTDGGDPGSVRQFSPDQAPRIGEEPRLVPSLANYPEPAVFHQFTYERGEPLIVEGKCKDRYYTIMLFEQGIDYRANPADARFNTAYPCTGTAYVEHVPIDTLFLTEGKGYYVVKAHQGEEGEWYDPY